MLKKFTGDLHIHTCLSPCGESEMIPTKIIEYAKNKGLDFIGISDHNSTENVFAVQKRGEEEKIKVFGGVEITSSEEVHILAFFDDSSSLQKMQEIIYENLDGVNNADVFGEQIIVDKNDEIIGINDKLLIGATRLSIQEIVDKIHQFNGLAIASHIDRPVFSIISQIGFIPDNLKLDAVEISPKSKLADYKLQIANLPIVSFSDAHRLEEIGKAKTTFLLNELTLKEIRNAILHKERRRVIV